MICGSIGSELKVAGEAETWGLAGFKRGLHVAGEGGEFDEVANTQDGRADGENAAVHHDVAVVDELTGRGDAAGKAEPEDNVVETPFEKAYETFDPIGLLESARIADEAAELLFAEAIVEEELLLFSEL